MIVHLKKQNRNLKIAIMKFIRSIQSEKAPYQYQKENEVPVSVAKSYLVNERRIDTALVEDFYLKD